MASAVPKEPDALVNGEAGVAPESDHGIPTGKGSAGDTDFSRELDQMMSGLGRVTVAASDNAEIEPVAAGSFRWNADAKEFVPRQFQPSHDQAQYYGQMGIKSGAEAEEEEDMLTQLSVMLQALIASPDQLELVALDVYQLLASVDAENMRVAVELIFETGLSGEHCGYSCSRLCGSVERLFQQHLAMSGAPTDTFRDQLLSRCQSEHAARANFGPDRLHALTIFLADLYLHFLLAGEQRINALAVAMFELLSTLLASSAGSASGEGVRTAAMTLKGCGGYLEVDTADYTGHSAVMDKLIQEMGLVATDVHSKSLVDTVKTLRAGGWAQHHHLSSHPQQQQETGAGYHHHVGCSSGMMMYAGAGGVGPQGDESFELGPDGLPLTKEEIKFIEDMLNEQDQEDLPDPSASEEDDEVYEAYEEFLLMQQPKP